MREVQLAWAASCPDISTLRCPMPNIRYPMSGWGGVGGGGVGWGGGPVLEASAMTVTNQIFNFSKQCIKHIFSKDKLRRSPTPPHPTPPFRLGVFFGTFACLCHHTHKPTNDDFDGVHRGWTRCVLRHRHEGNFLLEVWFGRLNSFSISIRVGIFDCDLGNL